jgi:hypothetical protein
MRSPRSGVVVGIGVVMYVREPRQHEMNVRVRER